jgi:hypothetical protein
MCGTTRRYPDDAHPDLTASVIRGIACSSEASTYPLSNMRTQAMMSDVYSRSQGAPLIFFRFSQPQLILEVSCFQRRVPTVVVGCVVNIAFENSSISELGNSDWNTLFPSDGLVPTPLPECNSDTFERARIVFAYVH